MKSLIVCILFPRLAHEEKKKLKKKKKKKKTETRLTLKMWEY